MIYPICTQCGHELTEDGQYPCDGIQVLRECISTFHERYAAWICDICEVQSYVPWDHLTEEEDK
jgi:hypothetical protein